MQNIGNIDGGVASQVVMMERRNSIYISSSLSLGLLSNIEMPNVVPRSNEKGILFEWRNDVKNGR